jgi:hypothetical protein
MKNIFGNNFKGYILWLSPTLLVVLAIAIAIIIKADDGMDSGDLTGFYSSFIALCTTFIVGFQIYSTMELNERIRDLDNKNQILEKKTRDVDVMSNNLLECKYYNAYTIGLTHFYNADTKPKYYWNSLRAFCNALKYASKGGHNIEESIDALSKKMQICLDKIKEAHKNIDNILVCNNDLPEYAKRLNMLTEIEETLNIVNSSLKNRGLASFEMVEKFKKDCEDFFKEKYK